jgi:NAD(P)-dependent dehydrogenase (short-subunit alcohol dehydrogenase family)
MTTSPAVSATRREPELPGQTVVVVGGSAGIGLETARRARAEGADVMLTGRNPDRLEQAAAEIGAKRTAAFDATDPAALGRFFADLPEQVDHVMVTGPGPYYAPLPDLDRERAHRDFDAHVWLPVAVAQHAVGRVRSGGTLLFMGGTGGRSRGPGLSLIAAGTAALPALIANLAVEVAPIRVNLIAAGFVDTPLSASLLGDDLDKRRDQLRATLPIGRVVGPADIAALAVHIMTNTALTGATYDIDGGQQLVSAG